jgi:hypothetical protein
MAHLGLQGALEHGLGHLVGQRIGAVDRGDRGLRLGQQRVDCRRLERFGEPASRRVGEPPQCQPRSQ